MTSYILVKKSEYRISKKRIIINLFDDLGIILLGKPLTHLLNLGHEFFKSIKRADTAFLALAVSFLAYSDENED
ncbi:hypothetical protein HI914_00393 [Erysiphe necator]|nr:hypothetical protein HI914_00393 [Erysiphe necator]